MVAGVWKEVKTCVFGHLNQLPQNKFFWLKHSFCNKRKWSLKNPSHTFWCSDLRKVDEGGEKNTSKQNMSSIICKNEKEELFLRGIGWINSVFEAATKQLFGGQGKEKLRWSQTFFWAAPPKKIGEKWILEWGIFLGGQKTKKIGGPKKIYY